MGVNFLFFFSRQKQKSRNANRGRYKGERCPEQLVCVWIMYGFLSI
jgi:hypothetical protein